MILNFFSFLSGGGEVLFLQQFYQILSILLKFNKKLKIKKCNIIISLLKSIPMCETHFWKVICI